MKQIQYIYWFSVLALTLPQSSSAVTFNTSLLAGNSKNSDLSRFNNDLDIPAGIQEMDIYVNHSWKGRYALTFGERKNEIDINTKDAGLLGIDLSSLTKTDGLWSLQEIVQGGAVDVDTSTLSVFLTVPQRYIKRSENGYVAPEFWESGVPAAMLSYNTNWYKTISKKATGSDDEFYAGLDSGFNLAGWQLRDSSVFRKQSGQSASWQNNTRYIRKPIAKFKSNFIAGDFYTSGTLFDSLRTRGISLTSDISMYPDSQQGFAPVVRGVARTSSLVSVIQNGITIYQENVPPGQFVLSDIQPTGSSGDLLVVVREADGRNQSFTVPFSSVPGMLKEGVGKYDLVAGRVNLTNTDYEPEFMQGTVEYGINNLVTGYAGTIISNDYKAWLLGSGWNFPFGAISLDVTHADTTLQYKKQRGQSYRVSYSKYLNATDTNLTLAAYRYSTEGYYSFSDAIYSNDEYKRYTERFVNYGDSNNENIPTVDMNMWDMLRSARPRNTLTLNLNQRLPKGGGTVFFSGTQRDYWNQLVTSREYQLGYSNMYNRVSYNITASRIRNNDKHEETRYYLSLSIPFSVFDNNGWISTGVSSTGSRYQQSMVTVSGNALDSNRLSYSLSGSNQDSGENTASANANYRTSFATLGAAYSESGTYQQAGLSAHGSAVAFPWHVLTSNEMGDTLMIVDAPEAEGLMVNGDSSIVTNKDGLVLVPYATPYRKNTITLSDTANTSGAEIKDNLSNIVPYKGAVSVLHFNTDMRQSWLLHALDIAGKALPFGAEVRNERDVPVGYVGQSGVLYIKADNAPDLLKVQLRDGSCTISHPPLQLNSQPGICR